MAHHRFFYLYRKFYKAQAKLRMMTCLGCFKPSQPIQPGSAIQAPGIKHFGQSIDDLIRSQSEFLLLTSLANYSLVWFYCSYWTIGK